MNIRKSYRIWTAPRTGHTLLAKMLELTGIAGRPGEHINLHEDHSFINKYKENTYDGIKEAIWEAGSGGSEIFGCKIDGHADSLNVVIEELSALNGVKKEAYRDVFWQEFFPNCKDIYLTRRNKVRQAVSWWKAIQDGTWHLFKGQKRSQTKDFYKDKYVFDAIHHLFKETSLREASIQDYFEKLDINPMTIVYEDMVTDIKGTILNVLSFLGIDADEYIVPDIPMHRTADDISEMWIQRFREEIQDGWDKPVW